MEYIIAPMNTMPTTMRVFGANIVVFCCCGSRGADEFRGGSEGSRRLTEEA